MRSLRVQLAACIALAAIVRAAAYEVGPVQRLDVTLLEHATHRLGGLHGVADALVVPFDPGAYLTIVVAVLLLGLLAGRGRIAVPAIAAMGGAAVTTQILKRILAEPRPQAAGVHLPPDAWPSGHTTAAAALAIGIVLLVPRRLVAVVAAVAVLAVGAALVILGHHYPSDVVGGVCVAGAWGALASRATRRRARPASP